MTVVCPKQDWAMNVPSELENELDIEKLASLHS